MDKTIWDSFRGGDDRAYEYMYKEHVNRLFLFGMTVTKDAELVKDCIQDVFIRIYLNRSALGATNNIKSYLNTALKNTIFDAIKKQNVRQNYIDSLEIQEHIDDDDTAIDKMIQEEEDWEKKKLVEKLMDTLTQRQKEIVYYRFIEGLKLEEISKLLNIEYHSVANVIQRALKKMRFFLQKSE